MRRGPFCVKALSNSTPRISALSTATAGTPKPSAIFTQFRTDDLSSTGNGQRALFVSRLPAVTLAREFDNCGWTQ